jgi:hypothetical protein
LELGLHLGASATLAAGRDCDDDVVTRPFRYEDGVLYPPDGPGPGPGPGLELDGNVWPGIASTADPEAGGIHHDVG